MIELLMTGLGIAALFAVISLWYWEDGVKTLVLAMAGYFCLYAVASALLFWLDAFSIRKALGIVTFCGLLGMLVLRWNHWHTFLQIRFPWRKYGILLIILAAALPFVWQKHEFFGMGQDEGVYQTQAINLMYGVTDRQLDLPEYQDLETEEEKLDFYEMAKIRFLGFYTTTEFGEFPGFSADEFISPVSGIFHGIPNLPALLALSGKIGGGISHMSDIQTLFWGCALFFVYAVGQNLKWKKSTQVLTVALSAMSPVVLWVTKSALAEPFLIMLISGFLYFLTEGRRWSTMGAAAAIITFSWFHVTAFIYLPIAALLFFLLFIRTSRREPLLSGMASMIGFGIGITMMAQVSPRYTYMNLSYSLYRILPFMTDQNCIPIVWAVVLFGIVIFASFYRKQWRERLDLILSDGWGSRLTRGFLILWCAYEVFALFRLRGQIGGWNALHEFSALSFVYLTGVLLLPVGLFSMLKNPRKIWEDEKKLLIGLFALYSVLFNSAFLTPRVTEYYYYARYLAPYIPVALLAVGMYLDSWKAGIKAAFLGISLALLAPFEYHLLTQIDDTHMTWEVVEDLAESIGKNKVVLVDHEEMRMLYFPLRAMTESKIYLREGELSDQAKHYADSGSTVYYVSSGRYAVKPAEGTPVYQQTYQASLDYADQDGRFIPLPLHYTQEERKVTLYRCAESEVLTYSMASRDFPLWGFGEIEEGKRWIESEEATIVCQLERKDYRMIIRADELPERVWEGERRIQVLINEIPVGEIVWKDRSETEFSLQIPKESLAGGQTFLTIKTQLWPASMVTEADPRQLGLKLESIIFQPMIEE